MRHEGKEEAAIIGRRSRPRFSDRLEFRRGLFDARAGRPPASIQPKYLAGYAEGRREARGEKKVKGASAPTNDPAPASLDRWS